MRVGRFNHDLWVLYASVMLFIVLMVYTLFHFYSFITQHDFTTPSSATSQLDIRQSSHFQSAPLLFSSFSHYDLFADKPSTSHASSVIQFPNIKLVGVITSVSGPVALLENEIDQQRRVYGVGQSLQGYDNIRVTEINTESVLLSQGEVDERLPLDRILAVNVASDASSGEVIISNVR